MSLDFVLKPGVLSEEEFEPLRRFSTGGAYISVNLSELFDKMRKELGPSESLPKTGIIYFERRAEGQYLVEVRFSREKV